VAASQRSTCGRGRVAARLLQRSYECPLYPHVVRVRMARRLSRHDPYPYARDRRAVRCPPRAVWGRACTQYRSSPASVTPPPQAISIPSIRRCAASGVSADSSPGIYGPSGPAHTCAGWLVHPSAQEADAIEVAHCGNNKRARRGRRAPSLRHHNSRTCQGVATPARSPFSTPWPRRTSRRGGTWPLGRAQLDSRDKNTYDGR